MKNWQFVLVGLVVVIIVAGAFLSTAGGSKPYFDDASPVYYFWSVQCHYCLEQAPILEKLAAEGFRVRSMDVGVKPALVSEYAIQGTPTFIAGNGKGEQKVGLTQEAELRDFLLRNGAKLK
ncbi:thioredoxin family protein [Candidatus Micrarchaeota archaeon]|nr:thioredoxin family protein [Candidatus Micrarchaeota archaeon]